MTTYKILLFLVILSLPLSLLWLYRPSGLLDEHPHDRNWTKEEYFQHIKEKHPDIWEEFEMEEQN